MSSDETRLGRWARRKAEARKQRGGAAPVVDKEPVEAQPLRESNEALPSENAPGEKLPEGLDLPDIDSLDADSDFSAFMKDGVPSALRRLALRKLWASDPMFNIVDEMVEYGEDYTNAAMIVEGMKSAWEPGRGYARDEETPVAAGDAETDASGADMAETSAMGEADVEQVEVNREASTDVVEGESDDDPELG